MKCLRSLQGPRIIPLFTERSQRGNSSFCLYFTLMSCFPRAVKAFIFTNFVLIPCVCVCVVFTVDFGEKATNKPVARKATCVCLCMEGITESTQVKRHIQTENTAGRHAHDVQQLTPRKPDASADRIHAGAHS